MNALFLRDLAARTHRGLEGRVRKGRSAGGLTFGYDIGTGDGSRNAERGSREINPAQAAIVERIFSEFAAGKSPVAIARQLNAEQVPGPGGRPWLDTTIRGHALRGTGILRNELYIGRLIWNRLRYAKDPDTGRQLSRINPNTEWVIEEVPGLRIIDQDLWRRVAARLAEFRADPRVAKLMASKLWERRRPNHFTSGRVMCGSCSKPMALIGKDYLGCNYARRRGTCPNKASVRQSTIEFIILDGLKSQLMAPDLVQAFTAAFHKEINQRRDDQVAQRRAWLRELIEINDKVGKLVDAVANGFRTQAIIAALEKAEARKAEIEDGLAKAAPTSNSNAPESG